MNWLILLIAGLFETAWAIGLKWSNGFSELYPSIFTILCMVISMVLLSVAVKNLPIGTAYAVWTGIGAAGTAILGIILFNEPKDFLRLLFIGLIIAGITGLKLVSKDM